MGGAPKVLVCSWEKAYQSSGTSGVGIPATPGVSEVPQVVFEGL